jgi:hypothetical protein
MKHATKAIEQAKQTSTHKNNLTVIRDFVKNKKKFIYKIFYKKKYNIEKFKT